MAFKTQGASDRGFIFGQGALYKSKDKNRDGKVFGTDLTTHGAVVDFGKYKGKLLTRVPFDYLRWAVNSNIEGIVILSDDTAVSAVRAAVAEMERRGDHLKKFEISLHCVDRLSVKFFKAYLRDREDKEGIVEWIERHLSKAILKPYEGIQEIHVFISQEFIGRPTRLRFVVDFDFIVPVVKTVK